MTARRFLGLIGFLCAATVASAQPPAADGLKIVVIDGEDGVNIVRKGTAVVPVVEVRDRNNLPVAGALVTFMIPGGSKAATFANSARQIAVTTDSAGRASASGMQAVGKGAFRVEINASYQGQTATTSISQSNFASVAEAAKAGKTPGSQSGSSGSSSSSGGSSVSGSAGTAGTAGTAGAAGAGAGAGGGGLSTGLIVGVAAAGAGAVAGAIYIPRLIEDATGPQCTSQESRTTSTITDLSNAASTFSNCAVNTQTACTAQFNAYNTAFQNWLNALDSYCTCLGPDFTNQLTAADRAAIQQSFNSLRQAGFTVGTLPSCFR